VENRGTILVVDDEQANLDSLDRIFAREGYRILLARSGEEAVESLRAQAVDVVLTDLMMPSMSGQELLRAVRAVAPDAEVVLMTAYGTVEAAVAAMKDGAYDFLTKPLKRHAVLKSVQQAIEKRRLVLENKELRARLAERQITVELTEAARKLIAQRGFDPVYGARPLRRYISHEVETRIGRALLSGDVINGATIKVDAIDGELVVGYVADESRAA